MLRITSLILILILSNTSLVQAQSIKEDIAKAKEEFWKKERQKEKLTLLEAQALAKEENKGVLVFVGCHTEDSSLFNSLKGKVILCYLPIDEDPMPSSPLKEENKAKVIFMNCGPDGGWQRASVAAEFFTSPDSFEFLFQPQKATSVKIPTITIPSFQDPLCLPGRR